MSDLGNIRHGHHRRIWKRIQKEKCINSSQHLEKTETFNLDFEINNSFFTIKMRSKRKKNHFLCK